MLMIETSTLLDARIRYYDDLRRLRGRRGLLLALLIDGKWHPNTECASMGGLSFNHSIYAFRREGWLIESRRGEGGVWEFRLHGKRDRLANPKEMSRPQRAVADAYTDAIRTALGPDRVAEVTRLIPGWMRLEHPDGPAEDKG
jgi:hypothetical protein